MSAKIAHVDFHKTPSDFGAQILESNQIKALNPLYNRRLRRVKKMHQFHSYEDNLGYKRLTVKAVDIDSDIDETNVGLFRSPRQAIKKLESLADQFSLCHKLLGLEAVPTRDNKPCFRAQLNKCLGACHGGETPELYNQRINTALEGYQLQVWPYIGPILIEERNPEDPEQSALHLIDNWRYIARLNSPEELFDLGLQTTNTSSSTEALGQSTRTDDSLATINFDLDIYFILVRFLIDDKRMKMNNIRIWPLMELAPENFDDLI